MSVPPFFLLRIWRHRPTWSDPKLEFSSSSIDQTSYDSTVQWVSWFTLKANFNSIRNAYLSYTMFQKLKSVLNTCLIVRAEKRLCICLASPKIYRWIVSRNCLTYLPSSHSPSPSLLISRSDHPSGLPVRTICSEQLPERGNNKTDFITIIIA